MNCQQGKIIKGIGGFYYILGEDGKLYTVKAKKKLKHKGLTPTVGDNVSFRPGQGEQDGWLEDILARKNLLVRPPVSNIDTLCIVICAVPKPDYLMLDLLLIAAHQYLIEPIIVYNKSDISLDEGLAAYQQSGLKCFPVSALQGEGLDALKAELYHKNICMAGQSGVGKSTLINALLGTSLATGDISRIERGRHTTRHVEIHCKDGISIFDTPGFSVLELVKNMPAEEIQNYYPELAEYRGKCRFMPCLHLSEPGCAVQEAVRKGRLSAERIARYRRLVEQAIENRRTKYD